MSAQLRIELLGPMEVWVEGQPTKPMRSKKAYWLLALLILRNGRPTSREWLASTLWPDTEHGVGLANLRPVLSDLRRALGTQADRLESPDRAHLAFNLREAIVDLIEFDQALTREDFQSAIELYRGPLMEGCLEEWVQQDRLAREQQCADAFEELANAASRAGDHLRARELYRRLVTLEPWRDSARRGLMRALAELGEVNEALQAYREFAALLSSEAGTAPDPQTTTLYLELREGLKQGRWPSASPSSPTEKVTGNLPHSLTSLVGLEDEKLDVADRLRQHRLVTLTGFGGIGKTRLAREVGHHVSGEFPGGVWFVVLDSVQDPQLVGHQVAVVLDVTESVDRTVIDTIVERLRTAHVLLILDNCEHLIAETANLCQAVLRECGHLRILATSREPLGVEGEKVWRTTPLSVPELAHLPGHPATLVRVVQGFEGVQLFAERARAADDRFRIGPDNALAVAEVCQYLEGIPLAIELAAVFVKWISIHEIARRVRDPLSFLGHGSRSATPRQQTLRATIEWSYSFLEEEAAELLRLVSFFPGGWTLQAAEAICGSKDSVLPLLGALVDKSLVISDPASDRYRLLETVRQYARSQPAMDGHAFRERYVTYFAGEMEKVANDVRGGERDLIIERTRREEPNIRQALAWAESQTSSEQWELRLATAWSEYCFWLGRFAEGLRSLEQMLRVQPSAASSIRASALSQLASMLGAQGRYESALGPQEEAREICRELGDLKGEARSARAIGDAQEALGNRDAALAAYMESHRLSKEAGDGRGAAVASVLIGGFVSNDERPEEAITWIESGIEHFKQTGERGGVCWSTNQLGNVFLENGPIERSLECYDEALQLAESLQGFLREYVLDNLAKAHLALGNYDLASNYLEVGMAGARELDDRRSLINLLKTKGDLELLRGEPIAAIQTSKSCLKLLSDERSPLDEIYVFGTIGQSLMGLGRRDESIQLLAAFRGNLEHLKFEVPKVDQPRLTAWEASARDGTDSAGFEAAWQKGLGLSMAEAVQFSLSLATA